MQLVISSPGRPQSNQIKPSEENMGRFFGCPNIFAFDQGNFFQELTGHGHQSIVSVYDKEKSKYEIECEYEKKYRR